MMALTLANLRLRAQQLTDTVNSTFYSADELNYMINGSYSDLYDLLTSSFEEYYITQYAFSLAAGTNTLSLPADFYKSRGLDFQEGPNCWRNVKQWNFQDRNMKATASSGLVECRIMGSNLIILPPTNCAGNYNLWYIPRYVPLVLDTDVLSNVLDFDEYIVIDTGIKMRTKEESDTSVLERMKADMITRVKKMALDRVVDSPEHIADPDFDDGLFPILPRPL